MDLTMKEGVSYGNILEDITKSKEVKLSTRIKLKDTN